MSVKLSFSFGQDSTNLHGDGLQLDNPLFRILAAGPNAEAEAQLERELRQSKRVAYFYWVVILSVGFLGATKPF